METALLIVIGVLAVALLVSWARTGADARSRFEAWRDREIARVESDARRLAGEAARTELVRWQQERESGIRRDAVARSTSTVLGKTTEHLAPYLGEFPYNPRDVRFIGSPVDLVVFDGLDAGLVERVVLVEIKSGAGQLSTRQRQVRDAVNAGQVSWDEWRLPHP